MADTFDNPDLSSVQSYYNWSIPLPPSVTNLTVTGDVNITVTSINGVTGPVITLATTLSGLSYTSSAGVITLQGTLGPTSGGTGLNTYTQGDILYSSAANTLAKLAKSASATRYLSNTGTSNNPAWAQVDLTNGVTGLLPVANGGLKTNSTNTAPAVGNDNTQGYSINSLWTDTTGPTSYICQSAATGAAVWHAIP